MKTLNFFLKKKRERETIETMNLFIYLLRIKFHKTNVAS